MQPMVGFDKLRETNNAAIHDFCGNGDGVCGPFGFGSGTS
jgi:hypothetical protein